MLLDAKNAENMKKLLIVFSHVKSSVIITLCQMMMA